MQLLLASQNALVSDSVPPVALAPPDLARRNRMVAQLLWLVRSLATALLRDHHFSISQEDLEAWGSCGLLEAADSFDHRPGTRFNTFAYYRIRGAMLDAIRYGAGQCTRTEMRSMVRRRRHLLRDRSGTGPANLRAQRSEPLERLTISFDALVGATATRAWCHEEDNLTIEQPERGQCHEEETLTPEQLLERSRRAEHVREAIGALRSLERRVVELLYYRECASFEAVAQQLGKSRSYICKVHARALKHLRAALAELDS